MKLETRYQNKKVLVLGLAISGFHAAKLLEKLGALVTVNDAAELADSPDAQELIASGIRVISGSHPVELLDESFAYIIKNPGIPYTNPMVQRAQALKIPIYTEVELAAEIMEASLVGVTGTNGKTTTTTMIYELLATKRSSGNVFKAGNIGIPASYIAQEAHEGDDIIMELSSFQLMGIDTLSPDIAVVTNISEAHLDYHGSREEYVKAKWRITENQTDTDYLVLNWDNEGLHALAKTTKAKVIPFTKSAEITTGSYVQGGWIYFQHEAIMLATDISVPGEHNLENALAAIAVAKLKGVPNEVIREVLATFSGVKHRLQFVKEIAGRKFYNDSKSTNILAAKTALASFTEPNIILLAGGLDRGNTFEDLVPSLGNVKAMIVFGETQSKLQEAADQAGITSVLHTESVATAVEESMKISQTGDIVLLSPACASWDQYANFEVRGDEFIQAVEAIKSNEIGGK